MKKTGHTPKNSTGISARNRYFPPWLTKSYILLISSGVFHTKIRLGKKNKTRRQKQKDNKRRSAREFPHPNKDK